MNRKRRRGGYTLIELVLIISVSTVILGINVGWIHQTMKFAAATKQRQQHHQALTRLAWELRHDVQASQSISMNGASQLVLSSAGGLQTTYTVSGSELLVEKQKTQSTVKRERFALDQDSISVWDSTEMPDWITLRVYRGGENASPQAAEIAENIMKEQASTAVDLHVRVGPNRWTGQKNIEIRDSEKIEEQK